MNDLKEKYNLIPPRMGDLVEFTINWLENTCLKFKLAVVHEDPIIRDKASYCFVDENQGLYVRGIAGRGQYWRSGS